MKFGDKCQYRTYSDMLHGWTVRGDVRYGRVSWQYWTYHAPRLGFQGRCETLYKNVGYTGRSCIAEEYMSGMVELVPVLGVHFMPGRVQ